MQDIQLVFDRLIAIHITPVSHDTDYSAGAVTRPLFADLAVFTLKSRMWCMYITFEGPRVPWYQMFREAPCPTPGVL